MSSGGSYRKRRMRYRVVRGIDGRERVIAFEAKPRRNMDDQTGSVIEVKISALRRMIRDVEEMPDHATFNLEVLGKGVLRVMHPDPDGFGIEARLDVDDLVEGDRNE